MEESSVEGVVCCVPHETCHNDNMSSIHVSDNSGAYMIGSDGTTIADTTLEPVATPNI